MRRIKRIINKIDGCSWMLQNVTRSDWKRLEIIELALDLLDKNLEDRLQRSKVNHHGLEN